MKKLIKKSVLALMILLATHSYSNVVDSIVVKGNENNGLVKIEKLKAGSILKIKDETGVILHKERINNSGYYSKKFDLSQLPDATYYFELDNEDEIRTIPVVLKDQKTMRLTSNEKRIAKPNVSVDGKMVQLSQLSDETQDLSITIYYEGKEVAFKESLKDVKNIKRNYDFSGSLEGDYTIVVDTDGKTFSNQIRIAQN